MLFCRRLSQIFFAVVFFALFALPIQAQVSIAEEPPQRQGDSHKDPQPADEVELLKIRVDQLQRLADQQARALTMMEQRLAELEQKVAALTPKAPNDSKPAGKSPPGKAAKKSPPMPGAALLDESATSPVQDLAPQNKVAAANNSRPLLQSADGNITAAFAVVGQLDFRGYQAGNHPPDTFLVRRAQVALDGSITHHFDYKIMADFSDPRGTFLRDAFVTLHHSPGLQMQFGQFKEPFSQEELLGNGNLDFVERSLLNNLVPSYSPGVMIAGALDNGTIEYQIGAFNGKGLLAINNTNTPEGALRLRFSPFKNWQGSVFKNLSFGGAVASGRSLNGTSIQGLTESHSFTFFTPEMVNGAVRRANGEFIWKISQAQIRAEYDQVSQERDGLGVHNTNLPAVTGKGFMTQFTYLLTGEHKADNGNVTPAHALFESEAGKRGLGAFELKARFARLQISDGTAKSNHAETAYVGANWYLTRYVKYFLDFGVERFNDPLRSPNPNERNFFVILSRFQFAF